MKLNYKDTIQYKKDDKLFKLILGISITFFVIFFSLFLAIFFFLKEELLEITFTVSFTGILLYLLFDLPFIIKAIIVKRNMILVLKHEEVAYVFQIKFNEPSHRWFFQSKFPLSFKYGNETKTMTTSWIYDSNNLKNSIVEVGYIDSLNKVIVIRKIN